MNSYQTPGVYVEEIQTIPPSVAAVATAIPVFIGSTEISTLADEPTRITSLFEYEQKFGFPEITEIELSVTKQVAPPPSPGAERPLLRILVELDGTSLQDPVPAEMMYYAVKHYFNNGGGPCWIYSLGAYGSDTKQGYVKAIDVLEGVDEPTLLVFPGATRLGVSDHADVVRRALMSARKTQDRFVIADVPDAVDGGKSETVDQINEPAPQNVGDPPAGFRTALNLTDAKILQYGSAYWPYLDTLIPWHTNENNIFIATYAEEEIAADGTPNPISPTALGTAMTNGTAVSAAGDPIPIAAEEVRQSETAVYNAAKAFAGRQYVTLPPSAAVAGAYATTDRNRGVWKSPANIGLAAVKAPAILATKDDNDRLNVDTTAGKSINVIRSFAGKGILIWGARTLAGFDNEFRYTSVRRLTIMIEESIEKAIGTFVFESNDANTWVKVRTMIENFLFVQWRAGALQGAKPEHAYDVQVGLGVTMTPDDILSGRMRVRVAIAPVRPAEFIILQFEQMLPAS